MDENADMPPRASQASAHFPLEPLPASLLLDLELARRERLRARGNLMTGCREIDGYVLLGGFERGTVVGVSAEEEEMGLLIGLQTVARLLATTTGGSEMAAARAMVITTLPATVLLPKLRNALVSQLSAAPQDGLQNLHRVQECLGRISIARVFDIEGLWEVLQELEDAVSMVESPSPQPAQAAKADGKPHTASRQGLEPQRGERTEVLDSQDEDSLSTQESSPDPGPPPQPSDAPHAERTAPVDPSPSTLPDIILITHISALLNALFTGRDKQAAHNTMLLLSSHLHSLTRFPAHGGPLIMLLNSTTSPSSSAASVSSDHHPEHSPTTTTGRTRPPLPPPLQPKPKPPEATLRSIFNPPAPGPAHHPPLPLSLPGAAADVFASARRNKPSYGLVFTQMLDLHLLCTRVPRTRADAAAVMAGGLGAGGGGERGGAGTAVGGVSHVWVVEVLLDEGGVYEGDSAGGGGGGGADWGVRRSREQRWAAVDVDADQARVVDAFRG